MQDASMLFYQDMIGNSVIESNYTSPDETEYTIAESSWLASGRDQKWG